MKKETSNLLFEKSKRARLSLLMGPLLSLLLLIFAGELLCRYFCDFTLLGTSRNLFMPNAYGVSMGNAPNVEAVSFGVKVYTDENGFRIPKNTITHNDTYDDAILILGDSVGFGS